MLYILYERRSRALIPLPSGTLLLYHIMSSICCQRISPVDNSPQKCAGPSNQSVSVQLATDVHVYINTKADASEGGRASILLNAIHSFVEIK